MQDLNGSYQKFANSIALTLVSRLAMVLAAGALPIAGWMLQRSVNTVDTMSSKIDGIQVQTMDTNFSIKLIQQNQESQRGLLADHEQRVRILEGINRARTPP